MDELEFRIKEILGCAAFGNDMEVPEDIQRLAKATRYLAVQLRMVYRDKVGDIDAACPILKNVIDILK